MFTITDSTKAKAIHAIKAVLETSPEFEKLMAEVGEVKVDAKLNEAFDAAINVIMADFGF